MAFAILGNPSPAFFDSSGSPLVSGTLAILDPVNDTNKASYPTYADAEAANADTSGATLVALETEVNELKAALRAQSIIT